MGGRSPASSEGRADPASPSVSAPAVPSTTDEQDPASTRASPQKRARTYSRRIKSKARPLPDIDSVFEAARNTGPVHALVVSKTEYLQQLWEIYRQDFRSEYTFPVFQKAILSA